MEKILDKKKEGKKTLYRVKWEGFSENEATWEPLSNLSNVKEMVQEFEKSLEIMTNMNQLSTSVSNQISTLLSPSKDSQSFHLGISNNSISIKKQDRIEELPKI